MSEPEAIATLVPSPARRVAAVAFTGALGIICLLIVLFRPPSEMLWIALLIATGAAALWLSRSLAVATRTRIDLTTQDLRDGEGRVLTVLDQVLGVERGAFALKPSNGFVIRLSEPAGTAWHPGLWWRVGRRIGVGGVTPAAEGRFMADALAALLQDRARRKIQGTR